MTNSLSFVVGAFLGMFFGVFLMCLMQIVDDRDDESACTGDCNQGRNCKCQRQ